MTEGANHADNKSASMLLQRTISFALILAIAALVYLAIVRREANSAISTGTALTGELRVSYILITSKTASSEETVGSTLEASRVDYFPTYVLVTAKNNVTFLWAVERLKRLEVTRSDAGDTRQGK